MLSASEGKREASEEHQTRPRRLSRAPRLAVSPLLSLSWKTRKNKACFAGYLLLQLTMSSGGAHLWRGKYLPHSQRWIGNSSNSYFILSSQIILHFLLGKPAISFSTTVPSGRSWTKATIGHPKNQKIAYVMINIGSKLACENSSLSSLHAARNVSQSLLTCLTISLIYRLLI